MFGENTSASAAFGLRSRGARGRRAPAQLGGPRLDRVRDLGRQRRRVRVARVAILAAQALAVRARRPRR